jgi:hypothetical protein
VGIFLDPEEASAGDRGLQEDLQLEGYVESVRFGLMEGDDLPVPQIEDRGVLDPPKPIHERNLICLAGPCRHYTECAVLTPSGPDPDADEHIEMERWCGRLRTWAEQTSLKEAEVYGCTCYEPDQAGDLDQTRAALHQSALQIKTMRLRAKEVGTRYGLCATGPCADFIEMIIRRPKDADDVRRSMRFCTRLQGLGRLHPLREHPVVACSAWNPRARSEQVGAVAASNLARLEKYRQVFAERPDHGTGDGEPERSDDRAADSSDGAS